MGPTLKTSPGHALVITGIYSRLRHPIYASLLLWATAQPFLLPNVLAGLGGPFAVLLVWLVRVPREEKMLVERFGDAYRDYAARTGRLLPNARP